MIVFDTLAVPARTWHCAIHSARAIMPRFGRPWRVLFQGQPRVSRPAVPFRRTVSANQQSRLVMWFFHTHWSPQCKQIYLPRQKNSFLGGPSFVHPSAASGIQLIETLLQCGSRITLPILNSCVIVCSLLLTILGNGEIISSDKINIPFLSAYNGDQ